jgi:hypothetical protein
VHVCWSHHNCSVCRVLCSAPLLTFPYSLAFLPFPSLPPINTKNTNTGQEKIRLYGIDAPETRQSCSNERGQPYACGVVSLEALKGRVGSRPVRCEVRRRVETRPVRACPTAMLLVLVLVWVWVCWVCWCWQTAGCLLHVVADRQRDGKFGAVICCVVLCCPVLSCRSRTRISMAATWLPAASAPTCPSNSQRTWGLSWSAMGMQWPIGERRVLTVNNGYAVAW